MNIIAFDLGGSGGKVVLATYKSQKLTLTSLHRFEHRPIPISDSLYWDILRIYEELNIGVSKAIEITHDSITSLGIDSFCNDFALVSPSGELVSQVRCYRDKRTLVHEDSIYQRISPQTLYRITGNQCALFNTFMQLGAMYFEKQNYLLQQNNQLLFIPDLLHFLLSKKRITEYTLASVSQLFDSKSQSWNPQILKTLELSPSLFPEIVPPGKIFAYTCDTYNQRMQTKGFSLATVCEHDTASAFLASIATTNCAIISCGTWALVGTETNSPIINQYGYEHNIANEGGAPGHHHRILRNVMGTWIIQEIRSYYKQHGVSYSYSDLELLAKKAIPFQYFIDVDDSIFFSPGEMPTKIQQYCIKHYGSAPQTVGDMILCIYEGLAFKFRWNIEKLAAYTNTTFETINILGGGAQSQLLCQFTSNVNDLQLTAGPVEATVLGNIIMQLIANKEIDSVEDGRNIIKENFQTECYYPHDSTLWFEKYKLYKQTLNIT